MVQVEITDRAKKYGYVIWKKEQDGDMSRLLGNRKAVEVVFQNAEHGRKNIDWKHRRISIGYRWTRALSETEKLFVLRMSKKHRLDIQCR